MSRQLPLGTRKDVFNNTWTYVDPQYVIGLGLWRIYPGIPDSSEFKEIGGILPIVVKEVREKAIRVSFSIEGLLKLDADTTPNTSAFSASLGLLQNSPLPTVGEDTQTVVTIAPVQHVRDQKKAVLYFDISSLPETELVRRNARYVDTSPEKYKVTLKQYNKSNGVHIDSEAPMVDQVIGSTATFSFNITKLPPV